MTDSEEMERESWPLRAILLLVLGALFGLAVHFLITTGRPWTWTTDPLRLGAAAFLVCGGIAFAFSLERLRWAWAIPFALGTGLVVGLITWWNGNPDNWGSGEGWRFSAALLAVVIAVPLFQAARDSGSRRLDPRIVQDHAWTNIIIWFLAWAFLLAAFLLTMLLGELFDLIGLDFLQQLMRKDWFGSMLWGGTFGAAVGLIRDRDRVLGLVQRVGRAILSVLAPVLAVGLVFFVLALPFTGLKPLWDQTSETTPILLGCILGATILANAVIGNAVEEEPKARILRWAAMALGAVMLPLAIVAAISLGKRIGQYGFTPDRIWAAIVVAVALAGAGAYLAALARGRFGWAPYVRRCNVALAAGICLLALFLALPIVSFGAISTRDQLARLHSGKVTPDRFDWAAMRFDFGPSGKAALERIAHGTDQRLRDLASRTLALKSRWDSYEFSEGLKRKAEAERHPVPILVRPVQAPIPPALRDTILDVSDPFDGVCRGKGECLLFWKPGDDIAIAVMDGCAVSVVGRGNQTNPDKRCEVRPTVLARSGDGWKPLSSSGVADDSLSAPWVSPDTPRAEQVNMLRREREAIDRGDVEVREVKVRQLFIGGKPASGPFK